MNGERLGQLAIAQNLDQRLLARCQSELLVILNLDLSDAEIFKTIEVEHGVLGAEDVDEAALRDAAMQRHLAAFKTTHQAEARTRSLAVVATGCCFAHARAHTTADTLAPGVC